MLPELKKIWLDTTTYEGRYVAKDVRNAVAFMVGILLVAAAAFGSIWGKTISMEAGTFLLIYSLGGQTVKEYFKYKNNTVTADCPPPGDSEPSDK